MGDNNIKLTQEQEDILKSVTEYNSICIYAFAGAGKTSTLKEIAKANPNKKILYLAFNKAIADSSSKVFPNNVKVQTTNSLAYGYTNKTLDLSNRLNVGNYKAKEIGEMLGIKNYTYSLLILSLFEAFCNSGFTQIDKNTIGELCKKQDGLREFYYSYLKSKFPFFGKHNNDESLIEIQKTVENNILEEITKSTQIMWNKMINGEIKVTHGFYLKFFHINLKEYIPLINYDIVLLDEAQDSNLVTLDIFNSIPGKKILVGDSHQNIYGFRGSSNIMQKFNADTIKYLSSSFRFNNKIASYADKILKQYKGETETLKSAGNILDKDGSIAYISRTNAKLIELVDNLYSLKKSFNFIRNPKEIFRKTLSVFYMKKYFVRKDFTILKLVEDKYLCSFKSIEEMVEYAEETEDRELITAININNKYGGDHIEKLYNHCIAVFSNGIGYVPGQVMLTTAHSAKGLEWDTIFIENDFPDFAELIFNANCNSIEEFRNLIKKGDYSGNIGGILEEFNLFYVACTRTKHNLQVNSENNNYILYGDGTINQAIKLLSTKEDKIKKFLFE